MAASDGSRNPKWVEEKEVYLIILIKGMPQVEWTCARLHEILEPALKHGGASDLYY